MTFEKVMEEVGEFGIFQKVFIFGFLMMAMVSAATSYWTQVFLLLVPSHRCKTSYEDNVWSQQNFTGTTASSCHLTISDSSQENSTSITATCPYGWAYDYSTMHHTFPSEHDWVCDNSWKIYTAHTCYWIGSIVGYIIFGTISDRYGRKRSFICCIIFIVLANIATFFSVNYTTFLIARFVAAMADVHLATCSFVWAIEYIAPQKRVLGLLVWALSYTLFSIVMPFITYAVGDWHYQLAIVWGVSVLTLTATTFLPESASWLMTRGRREEAAMSLHRVAKINGKSLSLERIKELLEEKSNLNSESKSPVTGEAKPAEEAKDLSFVESMIGLVKTPNMRKKTILLIVLWMIASMSYVGNSLEVTNLPLSFRLSYAVSGVSEIPANIICVLILDKIGRRWANASFFIVGGISGIVAGGFVTNTTAIIALVAIMRMCNSANFDITFSLASELLPTVVRGRGVSITKICGGLANATSSFIFSLSELDKLLPILVFGVLCVIGGILTLFLPEPAGFPLPQTLEDGENFGKTQSFFYCPFIHGEKSSSKKSNNLELASADNKAYEHTLDNGTKKQNESSYL